MSVGVDQLLVGVTPPRRPHQRWLVGAAAALLLALAAIVVGWMQATRATGLAQARPMPLYPAAACTEDLGPDLAAYSTPDSFDTVVRYYRCGLSGASTGKASRAYLFAGEVERIQVVPSPPDRSVNQALFLHRWNRTTTWTFVAGARNGPGTRILTGRVPDRRPPNTSVVANAAVLNEMWASLPWGASGGTVAVGGMAAGTCSLPAPFEGRWQAHSALIGGPLDYKPALTSVVAAPSSNNSAARPGVYWSGDEADGLRIAVFERFDPSDTTLAFLCAAPGEQKTRLFLARLLN